MKERTIVHLDLDSFFVSVERLANRELIGKPVIISGLSNRSVVASCSYEARRFGVHSAMPVYMAKQLCRDAVFVRGNMERYSKYSRMVTEMIAESAPVYEKASIDEHYLDITGMDRFFGSLSWTRALRRRIIKETGLPLSFGMSVNKTVAKIATGESKPNGELYIPSSEVKSFLFPLSVRKIPMVGPKSYQILRSIGVTTIRALSKVPPEILMQLMGKAGPVLWKKAHGIDRSPVKPYTEKKSVGTEHTFDFDITERLLLRSTLIAMVEKSTFELRSLGKLTGCVTVKIRYGNFDTHTLQRVIPYTAFDHVLIEVVLDLFDRLFRYPVPVRLLGVRFSHLIGGYQQLELFDEKPELADLYQAMDKMRIRFGRQILKRGSGV
ncbi:DNA polymerase IV [Candidatus Sulfidibacterium hydrothermale]|uniref:DNA polymerase IV n=1 Tax=Candidatus Sulfidibacterium hydrothermale TaxID=2875962 RepID=UPI001F0B619A|nr:DNA polymerase IV [Candidatus Sulfidibacterium hydrothermale]UBM61110.1 DNA polymerase IV [Candidatus Sulfidibacterium hydrothermale]